MVVFRSADQSPVRILHELTAQTATVIEASTYRRPNVPDDQVGRTSWREAYFERNVLFLFLISSGAGVTVRSRF